RLQFTTDVGAAIERSDVIFIAVGTPPDEDGSADLTHVLDVAATIGRHMNRPKLVVTKSTVPVGTAQKVRAAVAAHTTTPFQVCANHEFLTNGAAVGADVTLFRKGIGTDRRIGPAFLFPGPGYGGSCFPKDVKALIHTGRDCGVPLDVLEAVEAANERQKRVLYEKLARHFGGKLRNVAVAVWGLAFKAETDDVR